MATETELISFDDTEIAFATRSNMELRKALWLFRVINLHWLVKIGPSLLNTAQWMRLPINGIIRSTVFDHFCGGETLEDTVSDIEALKRANVLSVLDYGVEAMQDEASFNETIVQLTKTLDFAARHPFVPFCSCKITGLARFALLEKLHSGEELTENEKEEWQRVKDRFFKLCAHAAEKGVGLYVDSEETWIQQPLDELIEEGMKRHNKNKAIIFNTHQLYRKNRLQYVKDSYENAREEGYILGAKLVRGAYMEKERARAEKMGYPSPIHDTKQDVDDDYDEAQRFCVEHIENISLCSATHNEKSCKQLVALIDEKGLDKQHPHIIICQLYGMSDHITFNLAAKGYKTAKYIPFGPVKEVIPYLIRRAQENTSVAGQTSRELQLVQKEMERRKAG